MGGVTGNILITPIPIKQYTPTLPTNLGSKVVAVPAQTTGVSGKANVTFGDILGKVLDTAGKFFESQTAQNNTPVYDYTQAQQNQNTQGNNAGSGGVSLGGISPILLVGGGVLIYLLTKK